KVFVCHHSLFQKKKKNVKDNLKGKSKTTKCPAKIDITIKLTTKDTCKKDSYVKDGLPAIIVFTNVHNHTLISGEALSFLRPTEDVHCVFNGYFNSGLGISESIKIHEEKIELKYGINSTELANAHINSKYRTVRYWYDEWKEIHLGPLDGNGVFQGGLCKHCVIFRPVVKRGLLGSFIVKEFTKYNDFHFHAKKHMQSDWHKQSVFQSTHFIEKIIEKNLFCATHDIAIRGKSENNGNFHDLLQFRIEAGDTVLSDHLKTCHGKAKYTSHRIQNELILLCGFILRDKIVKEAAVTVAPTSAGRYFSSDVGRLDGHSASDDREKYGEFHTLFHQLLEQEEDFFSYMRMTKSTFYYILENIREKIQKQSNFRRCISPEERLMVTLSFVSVFTINNRNNALILNFKGGI
ncbi:zinc finger MYM-type protein 1-like, partial [Aphis craccivora]